MIYVLSLWLTYLVSQKNGTHEKLTKNCTICKQDTDSLSLSCQSSSHYIIKSSTKNNPDVFVSHFVHTFDVCKFICFRKTLSNLMTYKRNCNVQSCFETFVDKYLKLSELKHVLAFLFYGSPSKSLPIDRHIV